MRARASSRRPSRWPAAVDGVIAVVLCIGAVHDAVRLPSGSAVLAASALGVLCTMSVGVRRLAPQRIAVVAVLAAAAYEVGTRDPRFTFEPYAVLLTMYAAGRARQLGRATPTGLILGIAAGGFVAMALAGRQGLAFAAGAWAVFAAIPYAAGVAVSRHARANAVLAARLDALVGAGALRARAAEAEERLRVARDLHDVAAHCLTEMVIQAAAARVTLSRDRTGARAALEAVISSGHCAIEELHRLVDQAEEEPAGPGESPLRQLLQTLAPDAVSVEVSWPRDGPSVPPTIEGAAYRVLQESLTNAARHAPTAALTVRVDVTQAGLDLVIVNRPGRSEKSVELAGAQRSGLGLVGMRERVSALAGRLDVGPTADGGFRVQAWLPIPVGSDSAQGGLRAALRRRPFAVVAGHSRLVFWLVPCGWLIALVAEALTSVHRDGPVAINVVVVAAMALAAAMRRRFPLAFLVTVSVLALMLSTGLTSRDYGTLTGVYALVVPLYCVGSWAPRSRSVVATLVWAVLAVVTGLVQHAALSGLAGPLLAGVCAMAIGALMRAQRELGARLAGAERSLRMQAQQIERLAARRERLRLAEAHHAPVLDLVDRMIRQTEAALAGMDDEPGAPDADETLAIAIGVVEESGRDALTRMRMILGAIRAAGPMDADLPAGPSSLASALTSSPLVPA